MSAGWGLVPKLGGLLAALALGIPCGMVLRDRMTPAAPPTRPSMPEPPRISEPEPVADPETLRRKLDDANAELQFKVAMLEDLRAKKVETRSPAEKTAVAKELCDTYYRILSSGNRDEMLALMNRWGELDADMAPYFVARYRQSRGDPFSHVPLELALQCGGKDAGAFVEELLTGTLYTAEEKARVLRYVDGVSGEAPIASFPVSEPLLQVADQLSRSKEVSERKGAAGVFGMSGTPDAVRSLKSLAGSDPDPGVRAAAFRALGTTRDPRNLPFLQEMKRAWLTLPPDGQPRPGQDEVLRALRTSIAQLEAPK